MLDGIRSNAQSWGVKIAFGIIIVVFVFWGIGTSTQSGGVVATVNGEPILEMEFQNQYQQQFQMLQQSMPGLTPEDMNQFGLPARVLEQLILRKLLLAESNRTGIDVSPYALRKTVEQLPYFHNEKGQFDPKVYVDVLKLNKQNPYQFEQMIRSDLLPGVMREEMSAGAFGSAAEARARYEFINEKRDIEYLFFDFKPLLEKAAPSDDDLKKAYDERANLFALPAQARVEYVAISPAALAHPEGITDAKLEEEYTKRQASFTQTEQVNARHIILMLPENAPKEEADKVLEQIKVLEQRIVAGEDFAAVAKEAGQDGTAAEGGLLGWFDRAQMVPAFADAAFALKPGEMSGPVRSSFGYHLIKVEDYKAAGLRSLDEVREELRTALAQEEATTKLQTVQDDLLTAILGGKDMSSAATAAGLTLADTGLIPQNEVESVLGIQVTDAQHLLASPVGKVMDTALSTREGVIIARMAEIKPESVRPFEEVKEGLVESLTRAKARELAQHEAETVRASFVNNTVPQEWADKVQTAKGMGRDGFVEPLGLSMDLAKALFIAKPDEGWLPRAFSVDEGAVLARYVGKAPLNEDAWKQDEALYITETKGMRADELYGSYLAQLRANAKIEIKNPALFQVTP